MPKKMATGWMSTVVDDQPAMMCSICLEEFRDPKLLPCCHTFCMECLEKLITKCPNPESPDSPFRLMRLEPIKDEITCPQCRTCHVLPSQGGVCALLTDYTIVQEQEKRQWQSLLQKKNTCGVCEHDGVTVSFCEDCESFLCSYCAGAHRRMKIFSSHNVSSLSSLELKNIKPKSKPVACQIHPDNCVTFYCATCCQLICNKCVATKGTISAKEETALTTTADCSQVAIHQSHVLHTLSDDSLTSLEGKLHQLLSSIGKQKEESQKELISIESIEEHLTSHTEELKKVLIEQVEQHIKELQEQCERDLKRIDEKHAATIEDCKTKKSALKKDISKLTVKERFASKAQNCSGTIQRIAMIAKAASELEKSEALSRGSYISSSSMATFGSTCTTSTLNEAPLVVRNLSADLKKTGLIQPITGSDFTCSTPASLTMSEFLLSKKLKLGSKSQVTVKASVQPVGTPQFTVIYGRSEQVLKSTVQQKADGSWLLECTPRCNGTHKIRACVFGHRIVKNVPTFTVEGELKEGDIVRRGPDSTATVEDFLKSKGEDVKMASQYKVGQLKKITGTCSNTRLSCMYYIEINWGHESAKPLLELMSFRWFGDSGFPIELAL